AVNVALKFALFKPFGAVGLAIATSVGVWINLAALVGVAMSRDAMWFDATFGKTLAATLVASAPLALVAIYGRAPALALGARFGSQANLVALLALGAAGAVVYGAAIIGLLHIMGIRIASLRRR
ncbi:MAG: lipid II flippase MurJ, partial [Methylocystis sp.]|nr:lipid II flippase MurJ [Methylocystis sp.]